MGLFRHKDHGKGHGEALDPRAAESFEVVGDDGVVRRYARQEFDELFETSDEDEVRQQVERGWLVLGERAVREGARGPSPEFDLLPGVEGLRSDGLFGYEQGEERTVYTLGFLKDGAVGTPE